jgi:hypothetical protein
VVYAFAPASVTGLESGGAGRNGSSFAARDSQNSGCREPLQVPDCTRPIGQACEAAAATDSGAGMPGPYHAAPQ